MSGQLRALKNRIKSVESTKKITRAMEMVAASKLRRFQDMMIKGRPFTEGVGNLLKRLLKAQSSIKSGGRSKKKRQKVFSHPFFEKRDEKKIAVVLMTSDTGLCGSYNNELIEQGKKFIRAQEVKPVLIAVGKNGINSLTSSGHSFHAQFTDLRLSRVEEVLKGLKTTLQDIYLGGEIDAIYVVYSHFLSLTSYEPTIEKLLPFESAAAEEKKSAEDTDYIFEPSEPEIFERLVPLYFESKIRMIFLESFVSEQIARMRAMHQATENAAEMIDSLVLLRNKARQASITKELIEIVSGSRALKI